MSTIPTPTLGRKGRGRDRQGQARRAVGLSAATLAWAFCWGSRSWVGPLILQDREERGHSGSSSPLPAGTTDVNDMKVHEMRKAMRDAGKKGYSTMPKAELQEKMQVLRAEGEEEKVQGSSEEEEVWAEVQEPLAEVRAEVPEEPEEGAPAEESAKADTDGYDVSNHMDEYAEHKDEYQVLSFGKHSGERYADVIEDDPMYCTWALQVSKLTPDELSPAMKSFVEAILRADPDWKWKVVLIGKHKGKPFEEVAAEDPEYCRWVLTTAADADPARSGSLLAFADYIRENHPEIASLEGEETDSEAVRFGKYKGTPYREVIKTNPDYAKWVVGTVARNPSSSQALQAFARFVKENAPEVLSEV